MSRGPGRLAPGAVDPDRHGDAGGVEPGTTYTTLGTGKHVLVPPHRILETVEATNGMLASGLNTAILFAILSSMAKKHAGYDDFFR